MSPALLPLFVPGLLILAVPAAALVQPGRRSPALYLVEALAFAAFLAALACALLGARLGAATSPLFGAAGIGISLRLDVLSL